MRLEDLPNLHFGLFDLLLQLRDANGVRIRVGENDERNQKLVLQVELRHIHDVREENVPQHLRHAQSHGVHLHRVV